jgi:hypothetical protein
LKNAAHEAGKIWVRDSGVDVVEDSPSGDIVLCVAVMFNVMDGLPRTVLSVRGWRGNRVVDFDVFPGVIEVIGGASEGVHFQFGHEVLGNFLQEEVDYHATFDGPLGVKDED